MWLSEWSHLKNFSSFSLLSQMYIRSWYSMAYLIFPGTSASYLKEKNYSIINIQEYVSKMSNCFISLAMQLKKEYFPVVTFWTQSEDCYMNHLFWVEMSLILCFHEDLPLVSILIGHRTVAVELSTLREPLLQLWQCQPLGDHVGRWEWMRC